LYFVCWKIQNYANHFWDNLPVDFMEFVNPVLQADGFVQKSEIGCINGQKETALNNQQ